MEDLDDQVLINQMVTPPIICKEVMIIQWALPA